MGRSAGCSASHRLHPVDQACDRTVHLANVLDVFTTSTLVVLLSHPTAELACTLASTLPVWDAVHKTGTFHVSLHELNLCLWNLLDDFLAIDLGTWKM